MLTAPFPYYGGKRRIALETWDHFGKVDRYIEPFFGSGAVLLANPYPAKSEIVCDLNGFVSNFWRSIQNDPEKTAHYADWPSFHHDLAARHTWLVKWGNEHIKLCEDPDFYDPKVAGWWCWGMSLWIGGSFCQLSEGFSDRRPAISPGNYQSRGIIESRQTTKPQGVMKRKLVIDRIPKVHNGKQASSRLTRETNENLKNWFLKLSQRLENVIILNRSWKSAVTPTILGDTDTSPLTTRAVFLDPPYLTANRHTGIYQSDNDGTTNKVAQDSYDWAVSKGNDPDYKIAYCCGEGDFDIPQGWFTISQKFMGERNANRNDIIMFSPACRGSKQQTLF